MRLLKNRRGRLAVACTAVALVAALAPSLALAGGRGATVVRGVQHEFGSCGENDDGYLMTGSLDGCWWVDTFDVKPMPAQGTMLAHGTEHFTGWIGTRFGTFYTDTRTRPGSTGRPSSTAAATTRSCGAKGASPASVAS